MQALTQQQRSVRLLKSQVTLTHDLLRDLLDPAPEATLGDSSDGAAALDDSSRQGRAADATAPLPPYPCAL